MEVENQPRNRSDNGVFVNIKKLWDFSLLIALTMLIVGIGLKTFLVFPKYNSWHFYVLMFVNAALIALGVTITCYSCVAIFARKWNFQETMTLVQRLSDNRPPSRHEESTEDDKFSEKSEKSSSSEDIPAQTEINETIASDIQPTESQVLHREKDINFHQDKTDQQAGPSHALISKRVYQPFDDSTFIAPIEIKEKIASDIYPTESQVLHKEKDINFRQDETARQAGPLCVLNSKRVSQPSDGCTFKAPIEIGDKIASDIQPPESQVLHIEKDIDFCQDNTARQASPSHALNPERTSETSGGWVLL